MSGQAQRCKACGAEAVGGKCGEGEFSDQWFCDRCWAAWDVAAPTPAVPGEPPPPQPLEGTAASLGGGGPRGGKCAQGVEPGMWCLLSSQTCSRAEQLRLCFALAQTDLEDRRLDDGEVQGRMSGAAGDETPFIFDLAPVLMHGSIILSTIAAAMSYAGEQLGLVVEDLVARSRAVMLVIGSEAMRNEVFNPAYQKMVEVGKRITAFPTEQYNSWLGHFERFLRTSAAAAEAAGLPLGPFVLGPKLCYADAALYDCLTAIWDLGCYSRDEAERAQKFPRLCALLEAVASQPGLERYGRPHAKAFASRFGELQRPAPQALKPVAEVWEVVGGGKAGIIVRQEKELTSEALPSRLKCGALVTQLHLDGDRLHYHRLSGDGPDAGWVSVRMKDGKVLATKTVKRPLVPPIQHGAELPEVPAPGTWRLLYYDTSGRGQQLRLLFRFTGTSFDDRRLTEQDIVYYKSRIAKDSSPLAYDFVPILLHGDLSVSTTAGSLQYLADCTGLGASGALERSRALMVVVACELMRNAVIYDITAYPRIRAHKKRVGAANLEPYNKWFSHFERFLRTSAVAADAAGDEAGPFVLGSKLCYADLALYDCFTAIQDIGCFGRDEAERARHFPRLCALASAVDAAAKKRVAMQSYGRPHAEHFSTFGELPDPRNPDTPPPPQPPHLSRRECLLKRQQEAEALLAGMPADPLARDPAATLEHGLRIETGSTRMLEERPGLEQELTALINRAYEESVRDVPARRENHKTVTEDEVAWRLRLGDLGTRCNRVLHVAFRKEALVGCISSSFRTPRGWYDEGVGQWGLLAVDPAAQGGKVASSLVATAMSRLSQECPEVGIEYSYTKGHAYSERLKNWYNKLGFTPRAGHPTADPNTTFRVCKRRFSEEELQRGERLRYLAVRSECAAVLASLPPPGPRAEEEPFRCVEVFSRFQALMGARGQELAPYVGSAFQFEVWDAGPLGKFFLDLRPGLCCAWYGEEETADCTVLTSDVDLEPWLKGEIKAMEAVWSGRVRLLDKEDRAGTLHWLYAEACK